GRVDGTRRRDEPAREKLVEGGVAALGRDGLREIHVVRADEDVDRALDPGAWASDTSERAEGPTEALPGQHLQRGSGDTLGDFGHLWKSPAPADEPKRRGMRSKPG